MERHPMLKEGMQAACSGNHGKAADLLARYVRENPEDAAGWLWLGYCLKDKSKATYCLRKAIQLDPGYIEAMNLLGSLPELLSASAYGQKLYW